MILILSHKKINYINVIILIKIIYSLIWPNKYHPSKKNNNTHFNNNLTNIAINLKFQIITYLQISSKKNKINQIVKSIPNYNQKSHKKLKLVKMIH
jgi:hypothetical protein